MFQLQVLADRMPALPRLNGRWKAGPPPSRLHVYWAIFTASICCYIAVKMLGDRLGPLAPLFTIGAAASCGWSWLLTRALFDPAARDALWPRLIVFAIVGTGAIGVFAEIAGVATLSLFNFIANAHSLAGSTVLLLTLIEPLSGYRKELPSTEKRFRLSFVAGYGLLMGVSVLWLRRAGGLADHADEIRTACAVGAIVLAALAGWYRTRHPLQRAAAAPAKRRPASAEERDLADEILLLMRRDEIYTTANLKIADLARKLGAPDYKVTAAITAALGFANFNRLLNHYRIRHAQRLLRDPAFSHLPILSIALDCGFASIGPFNRAFKEETGATPREFRGGGCG